ncbi:hypothetical protein [Pedosphaera parvula]|uniref:hypothetical protein n=1 Tax=Pedosphaera parvula TaxID=1032527 RepID=UPI00058C2293|nr:hypothetical protein [Pedosphaera parvula]
MGFIGLAVLALVSSSDQQPEVKQPFRKPQKAPILPATTSTTNETSQVAASTPDPTTRSNKIDVLKGEGIAYEIESTINFLVTFTKTKCLPAAGNEPGSFSFILISSEPVFKVEASKKGWLIGVAGVVGKSYHDHSNLVMDQVFVSDMSLAKEGRAFTIPASTLRSLQERCKSDQITLDQLYSAMLAELKETTARLN